MLFGGLLLLLIAGLGVFAVMQKQQIAKTTEDLAREDAKAKVVEELRRQASEATASVAPLTARIQYVNDVMKYNTATIPIIHELTRYTYQKIQYVSIQISQTGDTVTVSGLAPSLTDAGRYLLGMYRTSHLFSQVSISGVPGYGSNSGGGGQSGSVVGSQLGFAFTATLRLKTPIVAPVFTGPAAGGAAGAPGTTAAAPVSPLGPPPGPPRPAGG